MTTLMGDAAIRLRLEHFSVEQPSDYWPEIGVPSADGRLSWEPAGRAFMFAVGTPDYEPDEKWVPDLPAVWREQFVALGRELCRLSRGMDLGPAAGASRPARG